MKTQRIENRLKSLVVAAILGAGTLLAGTGCDDDTVTKCVTDAARIHDNRTSPFDPTSSVSGAGSIIHALLGT